MDNESYSANDYYQSLLSGSELIIINGETWEMWKITDKINVEDMREAFQLSVIENTHAVSELYIKTILQIMEA